MDAIDHILNARKKVTHRRVTARKHMGDDAGSWAVFLDGRPVVTGLNKSEVSYYKRQVIATLPEPKE